MGEKVFGFMERTIVITGATGGLGTQIVNKYIKDIDTKLICTYRNEKKWNNLYGETKSNAITIDTTKNPISMIAQYCEGTKEVVLVLNAFSIEPLDNIGFFSDKQIESAITVNILQQIELINSVVLEVKKNEQSLRIINIDSGAADFPLKGWGIYCASKSFINAFLNVLRLENPEIKIVSIDPGVMDTSMQKVIRDTSSEIFDKVNDFIEYKNKNILRNPSDVADYITSNYIDNWNAINFREKVK